MTRTSAGNLGTKPEDLVFRDKTGKVRLLVEKSGRITVTKGYAWNGCSPKFCVFDLLLAQRTASFMTPLGGENRSS